MNAPLGIDVIWLPSRLLHDSLCKNSRRDAKVHRYIQCSQSSKSSECPTSNRCHLVPAQVPAPAVCNISHNYAIGNRFIQESEVSKSSKCTIMNRFDTVSVQVPVPVKCEKLRCERDRTS